MTKSENFKPKEQDATRFLSSCMEIKDEEELRTIRLACRACTGVMTKYFAEEMSTLIDEEKKITHSKFSEKIEETIDNDKFFTSKDLKLGTDFDPLQLDWCYTPIIQSGNSFDLKPSALSDDKILKPGVILASMGLRYKSYCSNIGRTYLIDPTKEQEKNYLFLVELQKKVFSFLEDGAIAKDIYNKTIEYIKQKRPELESHFLKNVGWAIGIDFRDATFLLSGKNDRVLKNGMTFNISLGFRDISEKNKTYSISLIDTVRISTDEPIVLTDSPRGKGDISYYFKDEEDDTKDLEVAGSAKAKTVKSENSKPRKSTTVPTERKRKEQRVKTEIATRNSAILKSKLRTETKNYDEEAEQRRKEHQKQLHEQRQEEGLERFNKGQKADNSDSKPVFKKFESYKREAQLPNSVKELKIVVDHKNQTIILPICGRPVPFHINSYKNGSKNEESNGYIQIRLNFHSPGAGSGAKKEEMPFEDANAQFVKSITFRSTDHDHMHNIFRQITDLKKESVKRETEKKELEDVVEQANLIEAKNRRPLRLDSVFVRPGPDGKRVAGVLEIHQNGLRYQSPVRLDHRIDVLFSNIKHFFFQPCQNELIAVIHAHLKTPIIIGKRKTRDVQFYREASDMQYDETGGNRKRRYRYGDEDELEQEQEERRRRLALDKEFKNFAEKISEAANDAFDVDIPFRDLGFNGVPFRSSVMCLPSTDCLVQLIDPPFLVITLNEIEIAHLERVQFGLKNFDLVFVYKDFTKSVTHINTIPMENLESVKDWLDEVDIPYTEGAPNLNWPVIMKTVTQDPHSFYVDGGWSFLADGGESGASSESEQESEFEVSDDDPSDEDDEESAYDESESDTGSGSGSGSGSASGSGSESGEDWDALDEEASRYDERKRKR